MNAMDTIKNYLESMFANLPVTPAVLKAKQELYTMMEDKYTELINEGKAENEAVGIVISEFGNLEELADSLGIKADMNRNNNTNRRTVTLDEAKQFINDTAKTRFMIGLGVMLCICCVVPPIMSDAFGMRYSGAFGVMGFFTLIAIAVGLFIYSGLYMNKWDFLSKFACTIDFSTADAVYAEQSFHRTEKSLIKTIGIVLCVICFMPPALLGSITGNYRLTDGLGPALMFLFVGVGVMMIIVSGARDSASKKLLSLNDSQTVSGNYESTVSGSGPRITDRNVLFILSVYWPTITCLYLMWSFITFDWHITWIIWPLAALGKKVIEYIFEDKGNDLR